MATASTMVDLPEPFSPTRKVTPLSRVEPLLQQLLDRGDGAWPLARCQSLSGGRPTCTTGGWSKSTRSRYGPASTAPDSVWAWPRRSRPRWRSRSTTGWSGSATPTGSTSPESRRATKLDLVEYYLAVGPGIVNALRERPCMLHRFPKGLADKKVHQKRLPAGAPDWVETVQLYFPRWGRTADELCVTELGSVIWAVQMSTVEFHPWNSRRADTEKPDEWRIDLDPGDECDYATVQRVAHVVHEVLDELGAVGFPKTSRRQGDARLRADPPRARLQGRTPGRPRVRPGGRAAYAVRRDHDLVAQGPRPEEAVRRLQPERARPHHRGGVLRPRRPRGPGLHADRVGRGRRRRPARLHDVHRARRGSPDWATCTRPSTSTSSTSAPLLEWADRDEAEGKETPDEPEAD